VRFEDGADTYAGGRRPGDIDTTVPPGIYDGGLIAFSDKVGIVGDTF
jgi:hypothetical protein